MLRISSGNKKIKNFTKGVSVIEILVVIAILGVALTGILGMASFSLGIQGLVRQTAQADNLAKEAMEAVRNIRDNNSWNQITAGTHGLSSSGGVWSFSGNQNIIDNFTRTVLISDVQRDALSNIIESGGTTDPDTKKITVTVSWSERSRPHEVKLVTYLTNWQ